MTLSVVAILSAVKKNGMALGIRTLRSTWAWVAAYECISSSAAGSTAVRPRTRLIITGKKTITVTIAMRDTGLSELNQLLVIGAKAMIGIEFAAIAIGRRASRAVSQRDVARATTVPRATPMARPPRASVAVNMTPF